MNKKLFLLIGVVLLPLVGITACSGKKTSTDKMPSQQGQGSDKKIEYYTCSMHPWVHEDKPGRCPACGMALTPVYAEGAEEHEQPVKMPETSAAPPSSDHEGHSSPTAMKEKKVLYYVDPMHPWYKSDKPGKAPDCGMDLVPVYDQGEASTETKPMKGMQGMDRATVRLSPEKQQLIGVKTDLVERRPLVREINASGRVAFDPDLMVAQNEYMAALKASGGELASMQNSLIRASEMRLKLLGMSEPQIQELRKRKRAQMGLIVPQKGESVWIYGSLFESDLPWVKSGDPVQVFLPGSNEPISSRIESIDPTIDSMTRTARVRLRILNPFMTLKPDMYVKLMIQAQAGDVLTVPDSALLSTGTREVAFVDLGNGKFEPREVKIGKRGTGYVEVFSGLSAGERVVTSANFLIDSESQLKAALSGMGSGAHGGH